MFLWGNENSGKSILHEALELLVTKGVVKADKALKSHEFNGELAGAVICAVEETNVARLPGAHARIKEYVTARTLSIREMRTNVYQVPNTTHWIQTANSQSDCPVFPGDTRITVIEVGDLLPEQEIAKMTLLAKLNEEAPHVMYTLMNLQLPPIVGRMRLPVVRTPSKARTEELNKSPLQQFLEDYCTVKEGARLHFGEFYDAFQKTLDASEKHLWSKIQVSRRLPNQHQLYRVHGERFIPNLIFKPEGRQ